MSERFTPSEFIKPESRNKTDGLQAQNRRVSLEPVDSTFNTQDFTVRYSANYQSLKDINN